MLENPMELHKIPSEQRRQCVKSLPTVKRPVPNPAINDKAATMIPASTLLHACT